MGYIRRQATRLNKDLLAISHIEAREFLLKTGYIISAFKLPEYYRVTGLDKMKFPTIDWKKKKFPKITKTLDVLTPKSYLSWRSFNFLNPYIYVLIVKELTDAKNWKLIQGLLTKQTLVWSYSTPNFTPIAKINPNKQAILTWLQMAEKDLIKDCVNYHFLTVTDIKDFYSSIYTHSIAWAINTKAVIKAQRQNYDLLGNRIDKLFQNSKDGQTNGISVGSMASDIIAEILLKDVDLKLTEKLIEAKLDKSVLIVRYRDDYRIMSKREDQGKTVLRYLTRILSDDYGLYLNSDKTTSHSDILKGAFRPWMLDLKRSNLLRKIYSSDFSECRDSNNLKDCLLETYFLQQKHIQARVCLTILAKITEAMESGKAKIKIYQDDIMVIISLLRKMTLLREEVTPSVFSMFEILIRSLKGKREKTTLLNAIKKVISGKSDSSYQIIWFYRLCLSVAPTLCKDIMKENDSPLLRVLSRTHFTHDFEIFPDAGFLKIEKTELEKFRFIDRKKLKDSSGSKITPKAINPFTSSYTVW